MISRRLKRVAGVIGASALLIAGATTAQAVGPGDIHADEDDGYFGWHQGDPNGQDSFEVRWDGLYFGSPNQAQIINGLVDTGKHPAESDRLSADELLAIIANSGVGAVEGSVYYQLGLFYLPEGADDEVGNLEWTTLRPANPLAEGILDLTGDWTGTGELQGVVASVTDLVNGLNAQYFELVGYGVLATEASYIDSILFDGVSEEFGYEINAPYSPSGDPVEADLDAFTVIGDTQATDVCGGIEFGAGGEGELRYDLDPIEITGETIDGRWAELYSILASLDGTYLSDEADGGSAYGAVHLTISDGEQTTELTVYPLGNYADADVVVTSPSGEFDDEAGTLGDLIETLADPALSVTVDGFSVMSEEGIVTLQAVQFYTNVNLVFPGVCAPGEEEPPTTPGDIGAGDDADDSDSDAATPVVRAPSYAG